jgi:hypothetical protein
MIPFIYDLPLLWRWDACSGRLSAVAEPTLFLLQIIAAGAFQDATTYLCPVGRCHGIYW